MKSAAFPNCIIKTGCYTLYPTQSSGMSMWTNAGYSNFHGMTLSLRKAFSKGISFDFNYTLSHSIDNGGAPESGGGSAAASCSTPITSARSVAPRISISGTTSTANVLYDLPFGKGKAFTPMRRGPGAISSSAVGSCPQSPRYRSGLPTAVAYTGLWPTNFSFNTIAYAVGP